MYQAERRSELPGRVKGNNTFHLASVILAGCPRACISAPTFDVNPSEYRERRPKHDHEKQERVSYVARQVSHKTDDEGAYERRRLLCPPESTKTVHTFPKTNTRTLSVMENRPYHRASSPGGMISAYNARA
jgi:hypothetical protein